MLGTDVQSERNADAPSSRSCSRCGKPQDRKGRRYCLDCHAAPMRDWRKTHPLNAAQRFKDTARSYANQYKRRGKLQQQPCEVCGTEASQMHHDDYSKPLEVRWRILRPPASFGGIERRRRRLRKIDARKTRNPVRRPPVRSSGPEAPNQRPSLNSGPAATAGPALAMLRLALLLTKH